MELRRVPPQKGLVPDLETSPTCHGNSAFPALVPPTILVAVAELTPQVQDPTTGGETGVEGGGGGGGGGGARQALERAERDRSTEIVETNMTTEREGREPIIYTESVLGHAGN